MAIICIRALILYFVVLIVTRLMGKRELGQLQPFEMVIFMLLANLASVPMGDTGVPLYTGVLAISALLTVHVLLAIALQKCSPLRRLVSGQPTILICRGQVDLAMMRRTRFTFADLMGQLRASGVFSAAQVEYAVLETNGSLSVLQKAEPTPNLPLILVLDGEIQHGALALSGYSRAWLLGELKKQGFDRLKAVPYADLDEEGVLSVLPAMVKPVRTRP